MDKVLQLKQMLHTARTNHDTTRSEAVRATKEKQGMQKRLAVAEGRLQVLVNVVADCVKAMLRFKLEGRLGCSSVAAATTHSVVRAHTDVCALHELLLPHTGDALQLGLQGDDRCKYAEQESARQLDKALGPVLSDLRGSLGALAMPQPSPGTPSPRRVASRSQDTPRTGGGEGERSVSTQLPSGPQGTTGDVMLDRTMAAFQEGAASAIYAVQQSVSDMHAQRERGIDLCTELGISLETRDNAAAAMNHALTVERKARQEALAEAERHVKDKQRLLVRLWRCVQRESSEIPYATCFPCHRVHTYSLSSMNSKASCPNSSNRTLARLSSLRPWWKSLPTRCTPTLRSTLGPLLHAEHTCDHVVSMSFLSHLCDGVLCAGVQLRATCHENQSRETCAHTGSRRRR